MDDNTVENNDLSNGVEWQPLAITLVEYPKGDMIGKFFAIISLTPFGILAGFFTLILFRRDLHTICFFIGLVMNEMLNYGLKHTICETRPIARGHIYSEYGMPSTHSQFMWFFTVYLLYFVAIRLHHINNSSSIISAVWRVMVVGACIAVSLLISLGRLYLQYHTAQQVVVGGAVGFVFATFWFFMVHKVLTPFFPQLVTLKICEFLMIRDTTLIPNVLWFEYTTSRQEARARGRKMAALKPVQ